MSFENTAEWNSIEFDESQLGLLSEIQKALFNNPSDPRSMNYPRVLVRPSVNWKWLVFWCVLAAVVPVCAILALRALGLSSAVVAVLAILSEMIFLAFTVHKAFIEFIRIYQRFAPETLRRRCRFEPSCSQYMICAIEKYGFLSGVRKGIRRLRRCNIYGGGFDEP